MCLAFLFLSVTDFGIGHSDTTGLGWVDGTGLGNLDTRLDTVDQTPTRDWPWLGGWDGPGKPRHTTRHSRPTKHPHATGLGWVAGMGQGSDTQVDTVDLTPKRDWPRLGGWDGPGYRHSTKHSRPHLYYTGLGWVDGTGLGQQHATHNTAHQHTWPQAQRDNTSGPKVGWQGRAWVIYTYFPTQHGATTLLAHGRVEGTGLGQQSTTRQHNTDSYGSGLMVGWMGRAWKTILYILTPIYNTGLTASATSQALVGWQGRAWAIRRNSAVDIGHKGVIPAATSGHDGLCTVFLKSFFQHRLGGWVGPRSTRVPEHDSDLSGKITDSVSTTDLNNKPGPGWVAGMGLGRSTLERTKARLVGRDGLGHFGDPALGVPSPGWLSGMGWAAVVDIGDPALSPPANQALVWLAGWHRLGHRIQHPTHMNQASVGRSGRAWDIGFNIHHTGLLQRTRPWLGGRDGPGTSDSTIITHMCLTLSRVRSSEPSLGWAVGKGLGHRIQHPSHWFAAADQASVGWLGRAWDIGHGGVEGLDQVLPLQQTKPWLGGRVGLGISDPSFRLTASTFAWPQALVGWQGWAWAIGFNIPHKSTAVVNLRPWLGGWDGPGTSDTEGGGELGNMEVKLLDSQSWDKTALSTNCRVLPDKHIMPWLGGWEGLGIPTNHNSTQHRFTTAVDQASAGRLGRAWDIGSNILHTASLPRHQVFLDRFTTAVN
ncbi:uncharacterized protein BO88DRAFT_479533 [Aspergillus vadensis CBS 113365]|uniref:Uncharacterized protein n=1 Tax=Aspergillus vadensis (strain CBS 113365 / IMI 142717 / IBT 24658) TaxID=1448311 RepID=A0A319BZJ0_ASPVC|nr:hypothetical protein BO88DRAFT_479533 [Aspergillus vadensis CBS 113365]PYH71343.1 hypothetical protein BO88DRAFT_479533 [Aspergillus vadensis CBS 113365]